MYIHHVCTYSYTGLPLFLPLLPPPWTNPKIQDFSFLPRRYNKYLTWEGLLVLHVEGKSKAIGGEKKDNEKYRSAPINLSSHKNLLGSLANWIKSPPPRFSVHVHTCIIGTSQNYSLHEKNGIVWAWTSFFWGGVSSVYFLCAVFSSKRSPCFFFPRGSCSFGGSRRGKIGINNYVCQFFTS